MVHRVLHEPQREQNPVHQLSHVHSSTVGSVGLFQHESSDELECQLFDGACGAFALLQAAIAAIVVTCSIEVSPLSLRVVAVRFYSLSQARGPPFSA